MGLSWSTTTFGLIWFMWLTVSRLSHLPVNSCQVCCFHVNHEGYCTHERFIAMPVTNLCAVGLFGVSAARLSSVYASVDLFFWSLEEHLWSCARAAYVVAELLSSDKPIERLTSPKDFDEHLPLYCLCNKESLLSSSSLIQTKLLTPALRIRSIASS